MTASEPFQQPDPQPSVPFGPAPTEPTGGGCGKAGVIGCGVVTILLGIVAVFFLFKAQDLFVWVMSEMEAQVTRALPEDCTAECRERLNEAFAGATEAVGSGEFDPLALRRLQRMLADSIVDEKQTLTREQVLELTRALEEVAGIEAQEQPAKEEASVSAIATSRIS